MAAIITDIIIKMTTPTSRIRKERIAKPRINLDGVYVKDLGPPWVGLADLLIDRHTRELIGVTYILPPNAWSAAAELQAGLDPLATRLDTTSAQLSREPYQHENTNIHHFEILFSNRRPTDVLLAQLSNDRWYYIDSGSGQEGLSETVVAYGIFGIEDILNDFDLILM